MSLNFPYLHHIIGSNSKFIDGNDVIIRIINLIYKDHCCNFAFGSKLRLLKDSLLKTINNL